MSELAIVDSEAFHQIDEIAKYKMQGMTDAGVARKLGLKKVDVIEGYNRWKDMLLADGMARDFARDHLNVMVKHFDRLIERSYGILSDLDEMVFDEKISAQKNATLKNISEYEAKRVDYLQKAGLLDAHDLGDELAEREEREAVIIEILRNYLCDDCKKIVAHQLTKLTNTVEATVVYND